MMFLHLEGDLWHNVKFYFSSGHVETFSEQVFQNIAFYKVDFCTCMQFQFLDIFGNVLIFFYIMNISKIITLFSGWVYLFVWN